MLVCDAEYLHLWQFENAGEGADVALPTHAMRVKSQGSCCVALSQPHDDESAWRCAWGCADGRIHFYDAKTQHHALFIPPQPLHLSPGGDRKAHGISAICFVFSHLVLCGDDHGMLSLVEFTEDDSPQVAQFLGVHSGKRITSIDAGRQGTVVVGDESGAVSVWTTLPSPPYLQQVDMVDFSHLFSNNNTNLRSSITTLARVLPTATPSQTTNAFLAHPTSIFVAAKLQTQVVSCAYDYHTKKVTFAFPMLLLGDDLRASPLSDVTILQTLDEDVATQESGIILQPILAVGGMLLTPHNPLSPSPTTHFNLDGFGCSPKGVRLGDNGGVVAGFTDNQILLWKLHNEM